MLTRLNLEFPLCPQSLALSPQLRTRELGACGERLQFGPGELGVDASANPQSVPAMTFSRPTTLA